MSKEMLEIDTVQALTRRGIFLETCEKFGYGIATDKNGKKVQVAPYRDDSGRVVAQKVRRPNKEFTFLGNPKEAGLFGKHLFRNKGGKRLVITEGEIDAMAAWQLLGSSWPVVSLQNGASAAGKSVRKDLEFVESFSEVILCFDMDEPGRKAAEEVAQIITPGKCRIMQLPLKDAGEMLEENQSKEFVQCFWEASTYQPDGIVNGTDIWEQVSTKPEEGDPFPWQGLTEKTLGMFDSMIYTWTSGTGMGKSEIVSEVAYAELMAGKTVGYVALEESIGRTGKRMMAKHLKVPIHLPGHEVEHEKLVEAFKATTGNGRFFLYDHWGSQESDHLLAKLRYLIVGCGCNVLVLDHLSIIVSGLDDGDERKTIDVLMTKLRSLVEETGVRMHLVSHLRRPKGDKGHEGGEQISLAQLRGSHSIVQLSDFVLGLERDQQSETNSNLTLIRILKNRYTGETGPAAAIEYIRETGMCEERPLDGDGADFDNEMDGQDY